MKVLLFGATGLLGRSIFEVFRKDHDVSTPDHSACDIEKISAVQKAVRDLAPDIIINATGYTKVDLAQTEQELAKKLNIVAVSNLVDSAKVIDAALVHFSTDYVFDGHKISGYEETDTPSPLSVYGSTKAAGEKVITEGLSKFFIVRTSWLFGPHGKNFVDTMIEAHHRDPTGELPVVNDQIGRPTYSRDLARELLHLLEKGNYGIYHLVNEGSCSWYEFATEIFQQLGLPQKLKAITTPELGRPAPRPHFSVLKNTKLPRLRHWREALAHYLMHKTIII